MPLERVGYVADLTATGERLIWALNDIVRRIDGVRVVPEGNQHRDVDGSQLD
jgi:hypothetical protein